MPSVNSEIWITVPKPSKRTAGLEVRTKKEKKRKKEKKKRKKKRLIVKRASAVAARMQIVLRLQPENDAKPLTPSTAFRHLPPNSSKKLLVS